MMEKIIRDLRVWLITSTAEQRAIRKAEYLEKAKRASDDEFKIGYYLLARIIEEKDVADLQIKSQSVDLKLRDARALLDQLVIQDVREQFAEYVKVLEYHAGERD